MSEFEVLAASERFLIEIAEEAERIAGEAGAKAWDIYRSKRRT